MSHLARGIRESGEPGETSGERGMLASFLHKMPRIGVRMLPPRPPLLLPPYFDTCDASVARLSANFSPSFLPGC
eukprot:358081-Chlamydomonas_euryale.AAC.6